MNITKGYEFIQREGKGYFEISKDPTSNVFHITQIMMLTTGYFFPPYRKGGAADVITFLTHGSRSTHMDSEGEILGFIFNVCYPLAHRVDGF